MAANNVEILYPEQTVVEGDKKASADLTAGQFVYINTDNEYAAQTSSSGVVSGIVYKDALKYAYAAVIPLSQGPILKLAAAVMVAPAPAQTESIEVASTGFPTKYVAGTERGEVFELTADYYVVELKK